MYLDLKESLHCEELHRMLLDGAQEEAHVPILQVGLDPKEILDDTAVTLGLFEEKLDIWGQTGHSVRSQPLWKGKTRQPGTMATSLRAQGGTEDLTRCPLWHTLAGNKPTFHQPNNASAP